MYLIIYDIIDDRRRNKIRKLLTGYGAMVQKSCCESYMTGRQYEQLERQLQHMIHWEEDNVRVYQLNGLNRVYNYGTENENAYQEIIII